MASPTTEDYLKTIQYLQADDLDPVAPSAIAAELGVTAPTVTATMNRLHERGLVEREEYKGVVLTDEGERIALDVLRRHRLVELFLTERLNYDWADVHEEADRLEHHVSDKLVEQIAAELGDPIVDPHGAPIPNADLDSTEDDDTTPLSECSERDIVVIERVSDRDPAELSYLAEADIMPGTQVRITDVAPFGMITIESQDEDSSVSFPEEVATSIRVSAIGRRMKPTEGNSEVA